MMYYRYSVIYAVATLPPNRKGCGVTAVPLPAARGCRSDAVALVDEVYILHVILQSEAGSQFVGSKH